MTIRYTGDATNEPHLRLTDATNLVTATTNLMGRFTTLLKWHLADPVDAPESNRNNEVCWLYQTNRNPFVDHPEWVAAAFIPPLRAALAGTNVVLALTNDYTPTLRVEATTSGSGGSWVVITNAPVLDGGNWTLAEPVAGVVRFYRGSIGCGWSDGSHADDLCQATETAACAYALIARLYPFCGVPSFVMNLILFLDFDGVLNTDGWCRAKAPGQTPGQRVPEFLPEAVHQLNRILSLGDVGIVVSSSWRLDAANDLPAILEANGVADARRLYVGQTPDLSSQAGLLWIGATRGQEIEAWLARHNFTGVSAILDDDRDAVVAGSRHFQTDPRQGLMAEIADAVIAYFQQQ